MAFVQPSLEVCGLMDDFLSIEEIAPGVDPLEILAASWGIPYETPLGDERQCPEHKTSGQLGLLKRLRSFLRIAPVKLRSSHSAQS